jgi:hypothetical protein
MSKQNSVSKARRALLVLLCAGGVIFSVTAHARNPECSFEVKPVAVCEISFYKLLATPEKYDKKYIAVTGYVAISNGRLAVYPTEMSYKLSIEQDSFSIKTPMKERQSLADDLNRHYVRIVGLFNYQIIDDFRPGIGYISKLVDAHLVGPRSDVPEDHYLTGTPKEISQ